MSKRAKRLSYWAKLNSMWESSGMPQEKFCVEQGVVYKRFVYWRGQVLKKNKQPVAQPQLMKVVTPQQTHHNSQSIEKEKPSTLEVVLPTGITLHIRSNSDIDKASQLLRLLGGGL